MIHLLVVILDDLKHLPDLLAAWQEIGVPGVTLLESAGAHRVGRWLSQVGLPAIDRLFESGELRRRTLLAAIDDENLLNRAIAEAERVVGGFDRPNTGVWWVLPVERAGGLHKARPETATAVPVSEVPPERVALRDTPIGALSVDFGCEPVRVSAGDPLDEVARALIRRPEVGVACVVAEDGRLAGLLNLHAVADHLFLHILPEEFLVQIANLDDVRQFADINRMRSAADAMQEPVGIRPNETVKDAFKRMHEHHLPGLPVLDESNRVTRYINLISLLGLFLDSRQAGPGR
jgi:CBS domain-containing protein